MQNDERDKLNKLCQEIIFILDKLLPLDNKDIKPSELETRLKISEICSFCKKIKPECTESYLNNFEYWWDFYKKYFKKRTCWNCRKDLNIYDFLSDNVNFTPEYTLKLWQTPILEFHCCECFRYLKIHELKNIGGVIVNFHFNPKGLEVWKYNL